MPLRPFLVIAAVLLAFVPARDALAWNHTGHRVVATIAYDELTPAVRARLDAILRAHPRYEQDLLGWMPQGHDQPARFAFGMAGFWPDIIRNPDNPMHFAHHHPQWHAINVPFRLDDWKPPHASASATRAATTTSAATTQPKAAGPKDIVEAIAKCKADLRNPSLTDADKAVALCWLAHLAGDSHQPLHATTLFSAQFPEGDLGGNRFIVFLGRGRRDDLHAVWDQILGTQSSVTIINYYARAIQSDPRFQRDALPEVGRLDAETWIAEGHELGKTVAYRNGTLEGASADQVRNDPALIVPALPEGYLREAEEVGLRRIALAGHRLAAVLNEVLAE